jgi:hypothetical protein
MITNLDHAKWGLVIDSWEKGDLAGAVHGLEVSLDDSLRAIAKVKGGAA